MKLDLHIHTKFSPDSMVELTDYCYKAIEDGIDVICFTDHIDYNRIDSTPDFYSSEAFFEEFYKIQQKFGGDVKILSGVEFSEPHRYPEDLAMYRSLPYDMIMGSVHIWNGSKFATQMLREGMTPKESFRLYWEEVERASKTTGFNVLGHIDFPKRFFDKLYYDERQLLGIFKNLLSNNVIIEINTSALRTPINESLPDSPILDIYRRAGGKYLTTGSDSHFLAHLGAGGDYARGLAKGLGLSTVYFEKQKMIISDK